MAGILLEAATAAGDIWAANTGVVNLGLGLSGAGGLGYAVGSLMPNQSAETITIKSQDMANIATPLGKRAREDNGVVGDAIVQTDPVSDRNERVFVVGDARNRNHYCKTYMGGSSGWRVNQRDYRRSRLLFNTLDLRCGDCLTTNENTSTAPTHITGAASTSANLDSSYLRNYPNADVTVEKANAWALSSLLVKGKYSNVSSHFCLPVMLGKEYEHATGVRVVPYGITDLFKTWTGLSGIEVDTYQQSMNPVQFVDRTNSYLWGNHHGSITEASTTGVYVSLTADFHIHNNTDVTQFFEVYVMRPKADTKHSPLYDYVESFWRSDECLTSNNGTYPLFHPREPLFGKKSFRDKWKCVRKRVFRLTGKSTLKVRTSVPLSQVDYDKYMNAMQGETEMSIAGLTHWVYIKNYGMFGYDYQGSTDGVENTTTNSRSLAYCPGEYLITMHEKMRVLYHSHKLRPKLDQITYPIEGWDKVAMHEEDDDADNLINGNAVGS